MVIEIKIKLKQINKTAKWLSEKSGVSRSCIAKITSGSLNPKKKTLLQLSRTINKEVEKFNKESEFNVKKLELVYLKTIQVKREVNVYRLHDEE